MEKKRWITYPKSKYRIASHLDILHGLKSPGIFNENKRFLDKVIFIPQHSCLRGRYTWYSDFPTFRSPFCSTKRPSLRNMPRFPRWLPHSMWISFPGAAWGLGTDNSRWGPSLENTVGEQPIRIVIGPIWPSLSRTCVTVRYRDGTAFFSSPYGAVFSLFRRSVCPITLHNTLP